MTGWREGEFVEQCMRATAGGGVSAVVSSLSARGLVSASLASLCVGGRLVQTGIAGAWCATAVEAARADVTSSVVSAVGLDTATAARGLRELARGLGSGAVVAPGGVRLGSRAFAVAARRSVQSPAQHVVVGHASGLGAAQIVQRSVTVTGGLGALGRLVGVWSVESGTSHLKLLGRSGRGGELGVLESVVGGMRGRARVSVGRADTACSGECGHTTQDVGCVGPAGEIVMHAGGVLQDATLGNQCARGMREVVAPKLGGARQLERGWWAAPGEGSVLFSSVAALLGSGGQANYVAANSGLDAVAEAAAACGLGGRVVSVQWGGWGGGGMASGAQIARMERLGVGMLEPAQGLAALEAVCGAGAGAAVVTANPFAWETFLGRLPAVPGLFGEFAHANRPLAVARRDDVSRT